MANPLLATGPDIFARAPDHAIRAVLTALCNDYAQRKKAAALLAKIEKKEGSWGRFGEDRVDGSNGGPAKKKRKIGGAAAEAGEEAAAAATKIPEIKICVQCLKAYSAQENRRKACRYHDGELEVDYANWPDHDEDCHGTIDTEEMREEFPENFEWSCCGKMGTARGCTKGKHCDEDGERGYYGAEEDNLTSDGGGGGDDDDDDDDVEVIIIDDDEEEEEEEEEEDECENSST